MTDIENKTSLHHAASLGYLEIVDLLIKANATIDHLDANGMTPLICATMNANIDIDDFLINKKANLNIQDNFDGRTALIWATINNNYEIAELLLENGADATIADSDGKIAYDWAASKYGSIQLRNLFEDYIGSSESSDIDIDQINELSSTDD